MKKDAIACFSKFIYLFIFCCPFTFLQKCDLLKKYSLCRDDTQQKRNHSSVVTLRILFIILGCLMLGTLVYTLLTDGSPFRKELLTP